MILWGLTKAEIFGYTCAPQILPRLKGLIGSGFTNLAYFMALIYRSVNLLPANHPYLKTGASGSYSVSNVISEAANNLSFSTKHIDQIIIFFALIAGVILLGLQFVILLASIFIRPAAATEMPANYGEFFTTGAPTEDLALRLLDNVFGIPDIFGSKEPVETTFHTALHGLFQLYSVGLLVIAAMILAYFIFAVLAETAQTGTPFGKRFNHAWVPIRLVVAIGLLIPISYGMNSGQWITLYAAKFGSAFATNGWNKFNETIREEYIPSEELVANPNIPSLKDVAAFMMITHACKKAYEIRYPTDTRPIDAWIINYDSTEVPKKLSTISVGDTSLLKKRAVYIRFGHYSNQEHPDETSNVLSLCGDLAVVNPFPVAESEITPTGPYGGGEDTSLHGGHVAFLRYFQLIKEMWNGDGSYGDMKTAAEDMMLRRLARDPPDDLEDPEQDLQETVEAEATEHIAEGADIAMSMLQKEFEADTEYEKFGWGGAGIWYNRIANVNGKLTNSLMGKPQIKDYPWTMKYTCQENRQQNEEIGTTDCYNTRLSGDVDIQFPSEKEEAIAAALSDVFDYWYENEDALTGNIFIDTINVIFGTQGIFDMCRNANIHPLAQLSSAGKGLVEAAIRNLGFALGTGAAGLLAPYFGPALSAASGFFVTIASIGILIGFMLYYLVPFMPFLYFLFAVGGWIKGLFEAMVGVPLWALAHLRIDGQGLPGDAAINGYFLIFEIFLRPILIVFGMLASILIFGAMVKVLNEVFSLVVSNLSGFETSNISSTCGEDPAAGAGGGGRGAGTTGSMDFFRGPIDEFFFTIVYAILVYMIGMSSFKLIDLIPNNILRWMGAGVSTYNDQAGEPAEGLMTKMAVGGSIMGGQLQQAGTSFGQAAGGLGSAATRMVSGNN